MLLRRRFTWHELVFIAVTFLETVSCNAGFEWSPWSRRGPCSVSCGEGERKRTRFCEPVDRKNQTGSRRGKCDGPAEDIQPCYNLPCQGPETTKRPDCNCGCQMKARRGSFKSRLPYESVVCEWTVRATRPGNTVILTVTKLKLISGSLKILYGRNPKRVKQVTRMFGVEPVQAIPFKVKSNKDSLNISLNYYKAVNLDGYIELEADFKEVGDLPPIAPQCLKPPCTSADDPSPNDADDVPIKLNTAAVAGIGVCGGIIFLIAMILLARRCSRSKTEKERTPKIVEKKIRDDEDFDDDMSCSSGSRNRSMSSSDRQNTSANQGNQPSLLAFEHSDVNDLEQKKRLLGYQASSGGTIRGYPDGQQFSPGSVSDWPGERRKSGEIPMSEMSAMDFQDFRQMPVSGTPGNYPQGNYPTGVNNNPIMGISPAQMNMHMPHPQLGYMIRQAQLSFPTQLPPNIYQQGMFRYHPSTSQEPDSPGYDERL